MRTEEEKTNLRLVERVYEEVLGPIDPAPVDELFAPDYIQHNPNVLSGAEGLKQMLVSAKAKYPRAEHRVKRMLADGNLVSAHVHVIFEPGQPGIAAIDIFRVENGRIAEHWDVMQPVPAEAKNDNGMF